MAHITFRSVAQMAQSETYVSTLDAIIYRSLANRPAAMAAIRMGRQDGLLTERQADRLEHEAASLPVGSE